MAHRSPTELRLSPILTLVSLLSKRNLTGILTKFSGKSRFLK
jgi:hypothetical protein